MLQGRFGVRVSDDNDASRDARRCTWSPTALRRLGVASLQVYPGWTEAGAGQCCYRAPTGFRGAWFPGRRDTGIPASRPAGGGGAIESPPRGGAAAAGLSEMASPGFALPAAA